MTPRLIDAASALSSPDKLSSRGAKYKMMLMPESWLNAAIRKANRIGQHSRFVQNFEVRSVPAAAEASTDAASS